MQNTHSILNGLMQKFALEQNFRVQASTYFVLTFHQPLSRSYVIKTEHSLSNLWHADNPFCVSGMTDKCFGCNQSRDINPIGHVVV